LTKEGVDMKRDECLESLLFILENKLKVRSDLLVRENFSAALTGHIFQFSAIELLYLFLEIEREMNISINVELMDQYQFNSINGIMELMVRS